jgi:hypothetical protein
MARKKVEEKEKIVLVKVWIKEKNRTKVEKEVAKLQKLYR